MSELWTVLCTGEIPGNLSRSDGVGLFCQSLNNKKKMSARLIVLRLKFGLARVLQVDALLTLTFIFYQFYFSFNKGLSCTFTLLKTDVLSVVANFESPDTCLGDICVKQLTIYVGETKYKLGLDGEYSTEATEKHAAYGIQHYIARFTSFEACYCGELWI